MSSLVSVIMPAYNGEKYIKQAIQSVVNQSHRNWELLIIDDGSTDGTAEIVLAFDDSRIHYIFQENRGQAAALNHGLDLAVGVYVTTLDVDDWYTLNSLQERVEFLEQNSNYDVVYGDGYYCDIDGKVLGHFSQNLNSNLDGDVYDVLINNSFFGTGSNVMIRRSVFEKYQLRYDTTIKYCQDFDLYVRVAEHVSFGSIKSPTVWYRIHEDNMTISMSRAERNVFRYKAFQKIIQSTRFKRVPIQHKIGFYFNLLIYVLYGREDEQLKLLNSKDFQDLPAHEQGRIIRLTANIYIVEAKNINFASHLLSTALSINRLDIKTLIVRILLWLSPTITRLLLMGWQEYSRFDTAKNVFEINQ